MSEQLALSPPGSAIEKRSILASYVLSNILMASSEGFAEDLSSNIAQIEEGTHFSAGLKVTEAYIYTTAASSVLRQMAESFMYDRALILSPNVLKAHAVFMGAQTIIDGVQLTLIPSELHLPTVVATAQRLNDKEVPTSENIEVAISVSKQRGTVSLVVESPEDVATALKAMDTGSTAPDKYYEEKGIQVEEFNMANLRVPSTTKEVPYYSQFYEVVHGFLWMDSLLQDIIAIHSQMK